MPNPPKRFFANFLDFGKKLFSQLASGRERVSASARKFERGPDSIDARADQPEFGKEAQAKSSTDASEVATTALEQKASSFVISNAAAKKLEERTRLLESMTAEFKAQANELDTHTKALQVKGTSLEERTKQLEGVTGEINPQVEALHDITANLTFQSDALKTTIENLEKKFGELHAASNELNTRAIKLENKSVSQASRLGALGLQTGKHISRSHKIFWALAIAVALWPVAVAWLHLNHTKRLEAQLPKDNSVLETLTGRLNKADQARNKLQAQLIQTQAQLTQTSDELKSFQQQPNRLNTSIEQLEQRIDALEQKSSSREDIGRFWPTLHSANWLLTQPAEYYTLQLLTAINEAWLVSFIRRHPLPPDSAHFRITNRGWHQYMVVTGVYESAHSASQAIKALPQPWQRYNPWIRKIGGIQQNILAQLDG